MNLQKKKITKLFIGKRFYKVGKKSNFSFCTMNILVDAFDTNEL